MAVSAIAWQFSTKALLKRCQINPCLLPQSDCSHGAFRREPSSCIRLCLRIPSTEEETKKLRVVYFLGTDQRIPAAGLHLPLCCCYASIVQTSVYTKNRGLGCIRTSSAYVQRYEGRCDHQSDDLSLLARSPLAPASMRQKEEQVANLKAGEKRKERERKRKKKKNNHPRHLLFFDCDDALTARLESSSQEFGLPGAD